LIIRGRCETHSVFVPDRPANIQKKLRTIRCFSMKARKVRKSRWILLPRVAVVPGAGLLLSLSRRKSADIALDVYEHTIDVIEKRFARGPLRNAVRCGPFSIWNIGSLEQAKVGKSAEKFSAARLLDFGRGLRNRVATAAASDGWARMYF